jgi:hypothetical protein
MERNGVTVLRKKGTKGEKCRERMKETEGAGLSPFSGKNLLIWAESRTETESSLRNSVFK